jgi:hypothetical protein
MFATSHAAAIWITGPIGALLVVLGLVSLYLARRSS